MLKMLVDRFDASFPTAPRTWRQVGREAEHPLVTESGEAADLATMWADLQDGQSFQVTKEKDLITSLIGEHYTYSSEVGKGTVEVIVGPHGDLNGTKDAYEMAMERLVRVASAHGVRVLGYGTQPVTPPTLPLMTGKNRYKVLHEVLGDDWLWFTITASDQVHVEVSAHEKIAQCNLANLLSPLTVALCANSPIHSGHVSEHLSSREGGMGTIHEHDYRHGMPAGPWEGSHHLVESMADSEFLISRDKDQVQAVGMPFRDHLKTLGGDRDRAWRDFLVHDHYMWHSARLRTAHATVELRSACQQPPGEHMAACTLGVALVCGGADIAAYVDQALGPNAWDVMLEWRTQVLADGLAATEPTPGFVEGVLGRCERALKDRGRGEERYLQPLINRWTSKQNPAQAALRTFEDGGNTALIDAVAWK